MRNINDIQEFDLTGFCTFWNLRFFEGEYTANLINSNNLLESTQMYTTGMENFAIYFESYEISVGHDSTIANIYRLVEDKTIVGYNFINLEGTDFSSRRCAEDFVLNYTSSRSRQAGWINSN